MGLFKRIISEKVKFFLVVARSGLFNHVALNVFLNDGLALLDVLTNHACGSVGVGS